MDNLQVRLLIFLSLGSSISAVHTDGIISLSLSPFGLLTNLKKSPSLGVELNANDGSLTASWIVPHLESKDTASSTQKLFFNQVQSSYQLQVSSASDYDNVVWTSGIVSSSDSSNVHFGNSSVFQPGTKYFWRVQTCNSGFSNDTNYCEWSDWSTSAIFQTALWNGWSNSTNPIWASNSAQYSLCRKVVNVSASSLKLSEALVYVTASNEGGVGSSGLEKVLGMYRMYINGKTVALGPGRGETNLSEVSVSQYDVVNVTDLLLAAVSSSDNLSTSELITFALQGYHSVDNNGYEPKMMAEVHLTYQGSTNEKGNRNEVVDSETTESSVVVFGTDVTWSCFDATFAFQPTSTTSKGGGSPPKEFIDARLMSLTYGWTESAYTEMSSYSLASSKFDIGILGEVQGWQPAMIQPPFNSLPLAAKRTEPLIVKERVFPVYVEKRSPKHYYFDMGIETMGGIMLNITGKSIKDGDQVRVVLGEELVWSDEGDSDDNADRNLAMDVESRKDRSWSAYGDEYPKVLYPMRTDNEYESNFTLRGASDGDNSANGTLSLYSYFQHQEYSLFRYGEIWFQEYYSNDDGSDDVVMDISFWTVSYPYEEGMSNFESSNQTLNDVWKLCEDTLRQTSLDTFTDSNTRERLPYEADGFITSESWWSLQREYNLPRHSMLNNFKNPTWPTEWRQTMPLYANADLINTGDSITVGIDNFDWLLTNSMLDCQSQATGLVDFNECNRLNYPLTSDLIDWPQSQRDDYVFSNTSNVISAYLVGGLEAMIAIAEAFMASPYKNYTTSTPGISEGMIQELKNRSQFVKDGMNQLFFNQGAQVYCDGLCSNNETSHASFHGQAFALFFNVPQVDESNGNATALSDGGTALFNFLKLKGMKGSVYTAYAYLLGLYRLSQEDGGQTALDVLAGCDNPHSWCHMIFLNATTTMEAWTTEEKPNLSWSHPWATAPIPAIVRGLVGITPTAPAFASYTVRPQLGSLTWVNLTIPTIRGSISVSITSTSPLRLVKNDEPNREVIGNLSYEFILRLTSPSNTIAKVCLPKMKSPSINNPQHLSKNKKITSFFSEAQDGLSYKMYLDNDLMTNYEVEGNYFCVKDIGSIGGNNQRVLKLVLSQT